MKHSVLAGGNVQELVQCAIGLHQVVRDTIILVQPDLTLLDATDTNHATPIVIETLRNRIPLKLKSSTMLLKYYVLYYNLTRDPCIPTSLRSMR